MNDYRSAPDFFLLLLSVKDLHAQKCQQGFDAITCKISLWIFASCVLMWASPTWPFSYLGKN